MTATADPHTQPAIEPLEGGLEAVPGLRLVGLHCGIKPEGLDLGVVVADAPRAVAGVFTRNQAAAPPVQICRARLARERTCKTILLNSGNANALTGQRGHDDAEALIAEAESLFGGPALPLSTGVIGVPLPRETMLSGLRACQDQLGQAPGSFAQAMLTTDTCTKRSARRVRLDGDTWATVGGVAKGSGMIHPNMATMLGILATDAPIAPRALDAMLRRVADETFNRISVDGDTSTNDAVLALAGGLEIPELGFGDPRLELLERALQEVAADLAEAIVQDGEGATRVLEVAVTGARTPAEAKAIAKAIAISPLVKTALHGGDANWGRIIAAAGNAEVELEVADLVLKVGDAVVFTGGLPRLEAQDAAAKHFDQDRVRIELAVGDAGESATVLTSDLSADYVAINAHYRT